MDIVELKTDGYYKVVKATDEASGLKAIIAVHNINRGQAVGGTRLFPYASEDEALDDVLRLSQGMTYKSALANVNFGGGKSVIIADPKDKSPELFKAFGEFVNTLGGDYICAEDVNTSPAEMEIVHSVTPYVLGLDGGSGDPSPLTALGVVESIRVTANELGIPMNELRVTIQGIGHVGWIMTQMLRKEDVTVYITDLRKDALVELSSKTGAIVISPEEVFSKECDIFSPCAMGAVINDETIPMLNCKAVVGCSNNQLAEPRHAQALAGKGILYAPDYLVNAGGIINVSFEHNSTEYDSAMARQKVIAIGDTLKRIYALAKKDNITPADAADKIAREQFENVQPCHKTAC